MELPSGAFPFTTLNEFPDDHPRRYNRRNNQFATTTKIDTICETTSFNLHYDAIFELELDP